MPTVRPVSPGQVPCAPGGRLEGTWGSCLPAGTMDGGARRELVWGSPATQGVEGAVGQIRQDSVEGEGISWSRGEPRPSLPDGQGGGGSRPRWPGGGAGGTVCGREQGSPSGPEDRVCRGGRWQGSPPSFLAAVVGEVAVAQVWDSSGMTRGCGVRGGSFLVLESSWPSLRQLSPL